MRVRTKAEKIQEGDMTPMIDMTFQLIAFFMVLVNFSQSEQHEKIQLPESVLAKPPEQPVEDIITIHVTQTGKAILGGNEVEVGNLRAFLLREIDALSANNKRPADATIIVRAHKYASTGAVQSVIKTCQDNRFETFALRAKEEI